MSSNTLSTKSAICNAALALLRQDTGYANATVAAKCDNVWYVAWDALRNAHGWRTAMGEPSDADAAIAALPMTLRGLLVYAVARELAIPVTGRQEDLKAVAALFDQKVREAAVADMNAALAASNDPVLALLVANFKVDDAALANAFSSYTARANAVKDIVRDAILARHHWTFARKTAAFSATKPSDCIRVRAVLSSDGKRMPWSVSGATVTAGAGAATLEYTSRVEAANWPALARAAYVAAVAADIAQGVVGEPNAAASARTYLDTLAEARLAAARVADLNENGAGSEIVRAVKNVIKAEFRIGDAELDESSEELSERIEDDLEPARLEVLAAHNWNFARRAMPVQGCSGRGGAFAFTRPPDALRVTSVRDGDGRLAEYAVEGAEIVCRRPPAEIVYVSDAPEPDDFPPLVRRALVYRLASDVAVSLPQRKDGAETLEALYRAKLSAASAADAREANPGRGAWGRGGYVQAFRSRADRPAMPGF